MRMALTIVSIVLFVLAALPVPTLGPVSYGWLGLAFFATGSIV